MEHSLSIQTDDITLAIYDTTKNKKLYHIDIALLGETQKHGDVLVSKWIHHLVNKTWITSEALYEIATIIKSYHPETGIDWPVTFFTVEKSHYLNTLASQNPVYDTLIGRVDLGQKENTDEVNSAIKKIVVERLRNYGIIS